MLGVNCIKPIFGYLYFSMWTIRNSFKCILYFMISLLTAYFIVYIPYLVNYEISLD